ncbi:TonB-dependent receptor plug domain-containing protein [Belliella marina]|uniref:TonB-dependent receptor plug domain-containing protein n=1 Tax=Belliella marina TaxID=1644146 RepID=A0ABW4VP95_9BACT
MSKIELIPFGDWCRYFFIFSVMLLGMCYAGEIYAQKQNAGLDTGKVHDLDEVAVRSERYKLDLESPTPTQVLSGKDIEKLNSFSVADAIRYFTGVQLKDYGGIGGLKTINVRSLGSAHTSVFYDGVIIGNAQNGQVDLGKFSLDNIEAIELFNGQKSSIFQPAKGFFASNTLFLQSRKPVFSGNAKSNTKLSLKTGSFGLFNPSVLYEQRLSDRLSLASNIEYVTAHGEYKYRYKKEGGYDTTAIRQNGDINSFRGELTLFQQFKSGGKASYKAYFYQSERGLPGAIVANIFSHYQRLWDRNFFVQGQIQKSLFENHEMLLNVKYSHDYNRYVDPNYQTTKGALDNHYRQSGIYGSLVNLYAIKSWWDVSLATDFSYNSLDANLYRFAYPTRFSTYLAFSSAMHWDRLEIQANLLGAYIVDEVEHYRGTGNESVFCPVVSMSFQPFENYETFRLRGFYKESFRMPTFNDLYYTFVGNTFLEPEFTKQYNAGFAWYHEPKAGFGKSIKVQADAYYNLVTDMIIAVPSANLFRWTMTNLGMVEIKGLDVSTNIGMELPKDVLFDLGFNYTFQHATDITSGSTVYGDQIPYTPVHSGSITASTNYKDWLINYSFIYTGERYSQKANIRVNHVQPWYTSDLGLSWNKTLGKYHCNLGLEANNLFNQYYDVVLNFPMPGRNYRLKLTINV